MTATFDLEGESVLVTGATGSLGRAVATTLAAAGARLTVAGSNLERLAELCADLGGGPTVFEGHPTDEATAEAMVAAAVGAHGRLDALVNAGGVNRVAKIDEQEPEEFASVLESNVQGMWLACRAAGRQMIKQGDGGSVVNTSSTRGKLGHPAGYSAYCTSKAAVDGMTRALACEWGKHAITVNAIGPTVFRSPLTQWMYEEDGEAVREAMLARIPLGRLGEPDDMAGPVLFLLSPASRFVTGQIIYIDGGYTAG